MLKLTERWFSCRQTIGGTVWNTGIKQPENIDWFMSYDNNYIVWFFLFKVIISLMKNQRKFSKRFSALLAYGEPEVQYKKKRVDSAKFTFTDWIPKKVELLILR